MSCDPREDVAVAAIQLLAPVAVTNYTDFTTAWFDMQGWQGAIFILGVGVQTGDDGTTNKLVPALYESATTADTAATAVAAADIKGTAFALCVDSTPQTCHYIGSKRYVGVNFNFDGTGISTVSLDVKVLGYRPMNAPQTAAAAVART